MWSAKVGEGSISISSDGTMETKKIPKIVWERSVIQELPKIVLSDEFHSITKKKIHLIQDFLTRCIQLGLVIREATFVYEVV